MGRICQEFSYKIDTSHPQLQLVFLPHLELNFNLLLALQSYSC